MLCKSVFYTTIIMWFVVDLLFTVSDYPPWVLIIGMLCAFYLYWGAIKQWEEYNLTKSGKGWNDD